MTASTDENQENNKTTEVISPSQVSPNQEGNYSFSAKPKSVAQSPIKDGRPVNIMHDRRVYRGNTYASPVIANPQEDPVELHKQQEIKRRANAKKRAEIQRAPRTPDPVEGRKNADIQTELYLEELADKIPEADNYAQTDDFLDRAPSPLFIPQKSGVDESTEILLGELFDFDLEVEPLLQVIVGKTLEQAVMELTEENELNMLRQHQEQYERRRNAEIVQTQRYEEEERRKTEEKARRLAEEMRNYQNAQQAAEKLAARAFSQSYVSQLVPHVFGSLEQNGYIYDPVENQVSQNFIPWITEKVQDAARTQKSMQLMLDDLILAAVYRMREDEE